MIVAAAIIAGAYLAVLFCFVYRFTHPSPDHAPLELLETMLSDEFRELPKEEQDRLVFEGLRAWRERQEKQEP